jgi:hypothetical protein
MAAFFVLGIIMGIAGLQKIPKAINAIFGRLYKKGCFSRMQGYGGCLHLLHKERKA